MLFGYKVLHVYVCSCCLLVIAITVWLCVEGSVTDTMALIEISLLNAISPQSLQW